MLAEKNHERNQQRSRALEADRRVASTTSELRTAVVLSGLGFVNAAIAFGVLAETRRA